jgi:hypothetical protein
MSTTATLAAFALSAELIDNITEAVAAPADPHTRAIIIRQLLAHVADAVDWRHGSQPQQPESNSLASVLKAADEHIVRMHTLPQPKPSSRPEPTDCGSRSRCRST